MGFKAAIVGLGARDDRSVQIYSRLSSQQASMDQEKIPQAFLQCQCLGGAFRRRGFSEGASIVIALCGCIYDFDKYAFTYTFVIRIMGR